MVLLIFGSGLFAQIPGKRPTPFGFDIDVKPPIYYDIYFSINPDKLEPQINFMINIQYDLLFFTRNDSGYTSGYNISLYIMNSETEETVFSQLWKEKVHEKNFGITNSRQHYHLNSKIFPAAFPPGKYTLNLELTDETSRDGFRSKREIEIPDLSAGNFASEIVFVNAKKNHSAEIIVGENQTILEFNRDIYPYIQIMVPEALTASLKSELYFLQENEKSLIQSNDYDLHFKDSLAANMEVIKRKELNEGNYQLKYTINTDGFSKEIEKKFSIVWYNKPLFLYDLEMAILPMRYILSKEEWAKVEDYSDEKLKDWFQDYWKSRDPEPNTPLNEVQVEFYNRVSQANKRFRADNADGWDTDRGKSLILYGEPDRVDSELYLDNAQPYEVWYYEAQNKKLIFIDKDDDKSFRLVSVEEIKTDE
jgi:GWxTD domain-containing protein